MNNNSSQSRFAKITAKVMVLFLAVILSVSVLPELSADILPVASAAEINYTVPAISSREELDSVNANLASQPAGSVINVTLSGNINFTDASTNTFSSGITGLVIPANVTVNLFLNGRSIVFDRSSDGAWQLPYVYGIHNKGTLNIYSGASVTGSSTAASITIKNARTGMSATDERERAYCALEGVHNEGTLTINKGVNINISTQLHYNKINTGGSLTTKDSAQVTAGAAAVSNVGTGTSCSVTDVTFNVSASSEGTYSSNSSGGSYTDSVSFAYGIYGGNVSVSGETEINVTTNANHSRDTYAGSASDGKAWITSVALGVATSGTVSVTGGSITHDANITNTDAVKSDGNGRQYLFSAGIYTTTGSVPEIPECTITTPGENCMNTSEGTVTYRKGTVLTGGTMFRDVSSVVSYMTSFRDHYVQVPSDNVTAGSYTDEANNLHTTEVATGINAVPKAMNKGAIGDTNRVYIIYRYWKTTGKKELVEDIVGTDGNVGYSINPLQDGTGVVSSEIVLDGVSNGIKAQYAPISYVSGAEPSNSYYWNFMGVYYATASTTFSEYDYSSVKGTGFRTFDATDAINKVYNSPNSAVYIFVDYARVSATSIKAKVGTGDTVSTVYTGSPINANDIGLKILHSVYETDYTPEYNLDFTDDTLINVNFTYAGTNTAGVSVSDEGRLPTDAGTYKVKLSIPESTTYSKNPKTNKNRRGLEYIFTLIIEQAPIGRGDLPTSITLTYGETLADALKLLLKTAEGLKQEAGINGIFTFVNANDGSAYKSVCKDQIVKVKWTPSYSATATAKNYKETEFNVLYTVNKYVINITALNSEVVYGEANPTYNLDIDDLVGNEAANQTDAKAAIAKAIQYTILPNGATEYTAYAAGAFAVGRYQIKISLPAAAAPAILSNYAYVLQSGANFGSLEVKARPITVVATGGERPYAADDRSFKVSFAVEAGDLFAGDANSVEFTDYTGTLTNNSAGKYEISLTLADVKARITGVKASNYEVTEVVYSTGNKLYYTIKKAIPSVTTPVVAERYYQQNATLEGIVISAAGSSVPGKWTWEDKNIVPNVKTPTYKAVFTPDDATNYDIKVVDVAITVKPTPVVISYNAIVEYGDNMPNITQYTYTADRDPGFLIDKVKTSGNITPSTAYVKGSGVTAQGYDVEISAPNFIDTDGNYTFTTETGKITVVPRTITFRPEDISITYGTNFVADTSNIKVTCDKSLLVGNDEIEDITANGVAPTFNVKSDFNFFSNYAVGTYTITINATFEESANYTVEVETGNLTVVKADLVIKANSTTVEYGTALPQNALTDIQFIGAVKGEKLNDIVTSGKINTATTYYTGAPVTEDGYPIIVDITEATFKNYNVTVENGTVTVIKATPVISTIPEATIVYSQTLADAVFSNGVIAGNVAGSFVYESATTVPSYSANAQTNFKATFVPEDTANYNTVRGIIVPLTVTRKTVSGDLAISGIAMAGATDRIYADVTGLDPAEPGVYSFAWYLNGSTTATATGEDFTIPVNAANQTLTLVATANAPYQGEVIYTLTVAPELADVNELLNNFAANFTVSGLNDGVYTSEGHVVTVGKSGSILSSAELGKIVVRYNGSLEEPVDAGTYDITIDILTPDSSVLGNMENGKVGDKTVYSPIAGYKIGEMTITPATYNVEITVGNKTYDGTTKAYLATAKETGRIGTDNVAFDKENSEFSFASAAAGTSAVTVNKAVLKGADAKNYTLVYTLKNVNGSASILKKDLNVVIVPVERDYIANNTNVDLSFEINEDDIAAGDLGFVMIDEAKAKASVADAGAGNGKAVTVSGITLTGARAVNYNLVADTTGLTVDINKAVPAYPVPQPITLTYDSARKLSDVAICDGDTRWKWLSQSAVLDAGTYTYTAIYTPDDADNYATVEREVTVTITKAVVKVTADSFTVVYGEVEPTYSYTVTGLTGTDTISNAVDGFVLLNCSYQAGVNVGTYPIVLTGEFDSKNYDFEYYKGEVTVSKRPAYVEAVAVSREYEAGNYDVVVNFQNLTNLYKNDGAGVVSLAADSVTGKIDTPDAGSDKPVRYALPALKGSKAGNYELRVLVPNVYVEIKKANLSGITLPSSGQLYYGQKLSAITFSADANNGGLGNFTMENYTTVVKEIGTFTNVYKVVFTPFEQKNYNTITQYIEVTVLPAYINVALSISGTTQVGKVLYVVTNDIPEDALDCLKFEWYRVDSPDADPKSGYKVASGTDTYTLVEADQGKYIICTVTAADDAPYECNARCVTGSAIEEEVLTLWQKFVRWFYNIIANLTQLFGGTFG